MITEIHYPKTLAPEKLDEYLARGWFRMGSMIFTCHFLCFENGLYSAVWIRLPLEGYTFRKSLRKIITRNKKKFDIYVRKARFDKEKDDLYQLHKTRFEGYIAPSLKDSLFGSGDKRDLYDTWETCIYDGDKLVAASFFDLGSDTLASIMGLYDPSYEKHSLGIYTMLLEIQFGQAHKKQYYYPGYIVPGYNRFDYKKRIGATEYYNPIAKFWKDTASIDHSSLPAETLFEKLGQVEAKLNENNIPHRRYIYQLYDKKLFGFDDMDYFRAPLFLQVAIYPDNPNKWLVLEFDYMKNVYRFSQVAKFNDPLLFIYDLFKDVDPKKNLIDFLFCEKVIFETNELEIVFAKMQTYLELEFG